ncbi:MFS transporter [Nocardia sp. BMG111209]|uniref:MFS transporter n=1 Tax=Nocardia sp. BMG111209 TaxID=1160137 RepID=UPI00035E3CD8|nr:MFS transporter [Nocardia sp. BMG111209]
MSTVDTEPAVLPHGVRTFTILSIGQFAAICGVTLLNFAAAFSVYRTYSILVLGIIYAMPFVILVLASPLTGALVDRWGTRRALLVSNAGGLALVATLVLLPIEHTVPAWHGLIIIVSVPLLKALLLPAYEASVPFLVPKRHIGRANGMRMFMNGFGAALGPIAAGPALDAVGMTGVGLIAAATVGLGLATVWFATIPAAPQPDSTGTGPAAWFAEFRVAWDRVRARGGLVDLLMFFAVVSFGIGFVEVLLPRLVDGFGTAAELRAVLLVATAGMLISGVAVTIWGGPRRRVRGLLEFSLLLAAAMIVGSLRPNVALIAVAAFVFLSCTSVILGNVQTLLNVKVEPEFQGRVMGLKNAVYGVALMAGNTLAGFGGGVFDPLVGHDRVDSGALTLFIGGGPARGFALVLMVTGILVALFVIAAYRSRRLRTLEADLPDVTPEDLAARPER